MDPVQLSDSDPIHPHDNAAATITNANTAATIEHDKIAAPIDLIPEHEPIAAPATSDNYAMTSDEDTSTDTDELLATIERLTSELQLERDNNATVHDNLLYNTELHNKEINALKHDMLRLRNRAVAQPLATNHPPTIK